MSSVKSKIDRKYLFIAKRIDNGVWVSGAVFKTDKRTYIITAINDEDHAMYGNYSKDVTLYAVDPETIENF